MTRTVDSKISKAADSKKNGMKSQIKVSRVAVPRGKAIEASRAPCRMVVFR